MTAHKDRKRLVRERPARSGESCTTTDGPIIVVSGPSGVGKSTTAHLVAAAFQRSVHLDADDFLASVVGGLVRPDLPEAEDQNAAIGGALAASAMGMAKDGYLAAVSGCLFPDGVAGLAAACRRRELACHYVVLMADLETCWERASARGTEGRWPLEFEPFARVHARFSQLGLDHRHVIDTTGSIDAVSETVLAALRAGELAVVTDSQPG